MAKKICVLASGGDAPGMNACIEAFAFAAFSKGLEPYGAVKGYDGLIKNEIVQLIDRSRTHKGSLVSRENARNVRGISGQCGSVLKCGRSPDFANPEGFNRALATIQKHGFATIVVIGGNGSFQGAACLKAAGVPVIAIPATVDNDLFYTRHNLGFSSACENAVQMVDMLKATMQTNNRDHVVQLMGRHCPALALKVGIATFSDIVDIDGHRHTPQQAAQILKQKRAQGSESCTMIMQERKGADSIHEAIESANYLRDLAIAANDNQIRMNTLGHLQRGASVTAHDRWLGANYGVMAVDLAINGQFGTAVGWIKDQFSAVSIETANNAKSNHHETEYQILSRLS